MLDYALKNGQESRKEIIVKLRHYWHEFLDSKDWYLARPNIQRPKIVVFCPVATGNPGRTVGNALPGLS
jgi:hypothetical protein